jgi:hypothetical protein
MKKFIIGALSVLAIGAGALFATNMGDEEQPGEPGVETPIDIPKPSEAVLADKHIDHNGKKIRIIGAKPKDGATVADTDVGRSVEADSLDENALCNIILEGTKTTISALYGEGTDRRKIPDLPDLKNQMGKTSWPVLIGCKKSGDKKCLWNWLAKGQECLAGADSKGYLLSSITEAYKLNTPYKEILLETTGTCTDPELGDHDCVVPFGDPRAKPDAEIFIPHGWAGLNKLNFHKIKNGKIKLKYKETDYE